MEHQGLLGNPLRSSVLVWKLRRCSLIYDGEHAEIRPGAFPSPNPELFHETFTDLNTTMADEGVGLLRCNPNYQVFFHDNEKIVLLSDLAQMKPEIEKWEGGKMDFNAALPSWLRDT
ncbi:uncharacterized protein DFL_004894 [Arthrobotrys flagrans]|uniref:Uncharacterized protein n=1 Tax=Arthrobotrys flagrans TaxID=97331 RepID=A0A437A634_ARTFL|nr:hypothetical protein DFL_004894 [Arthrobotrys flagrans]